MVDRVNALPDLIRTEEKDLNHRIAEGMATITVEKNLRELEAELLRSSTWVDNKSEDFLLDATLLQQQAASKLQTAVRETCDAIRDDISTVCAERMGEVFACFEYWHKIKQTISAMGLPTPLKAYGGVQIHASKFVAKMYRDREALGRYKRMTAILDDTMGRAKWIFQDALKAEANKAKEDAEKETKRRLAISEGLAKKKLDDVVKLIIEKCRPQLPNVTGKSISLRARGLLMDDHMPTTKDLNKIARDTSEYIVEEFRWNEANAKTETVQND